MLRPTFLVRTAASLVAAACVAAPSASAADVEVSVPDKCFVSYPGSDLLDAYGEPIPVEVEGLPANVPIRLTLEVKGTQTASSPLLISGKRGTLDTTLDRWVAGMGDGPTQETPARLVVRDYWLGTYYGAADLHVANIGAHVDGELLSMATKRRWFVSGLSEVANRRAYYAHYFYTDGSTKPFAKQYLGKTQDRCGFLRAKKVTLPGKIQPDSFEVRVQAAASYSSDEPYIPFQFVKVGM